MCDRQMCLIKSSDFFSKIQNFTKKLRIVRFKRIARVSNRVLMIHDLKITRLARNEEGGQRVRRSWQYALITRLVWQKLIPRRGGSLFRKRNIELHTHESFASFVETIRDSVRNANIPALENTFEFDLQDISLAVRSGFVHPEHRESTYRHLPLQKKKYDSKIIKYIPRHRGIVFKR